MATLRFVVAGEVFEAFPTAHKDIAAKPTSQPPLVFLRALASGPTPDDALAFCAYLLPRREAVWWACQCVRALLGQPTEEDEVALQAAEAWVRTKSGGARRSQSAGPQSAMPPAPGWRARPPGRAAASSSANMAERRHRGN